jgi:hypothetical protein
MTRCGEFVSRSFGRRECRVCEAQTVRVRAFLFDVSASAPALTEAPVGRAFPLAWDHHTHCFRCNGRPAVGMLLAAMVSETTLTLAQLKADARYLRMSVQAGELLAQSLNYRQTLLNVCQAAVTTVADLSFLHLNEGGRVECVAAAHRDPSLSAEAFQIGSYLESEEGRPLHPILKVMETGYPFVAPSIDDRWIDVHATSKRHAEFIRRMGYSSVMIVPVISLLYGVAGALTLVTTSSGRPRLEGPDAVLFVTDLGRRCGTAIGKARIHAQALAVAEQFQRAALPRALPELPQAQISAVYEPARHSLLVGGDWYDVFVLPDERIAISIGDVSGHGLEAAVLMASIRNSLRTALVLDLDLPRALEAADFLLRAENSSLADPRFCTAMVGILDQRSLTLECAAAGHPGPKIWKPSGEVVDPFTLRGFPLGLRSMQEEPARSSRITLEDGSLVVFYTDGLVEDNRNLIEGERMLEETISRAEIRAAESPASAIRTAMVPGRGRDDIAILALRVRVPSSHRTLPP